MLTVPDTIHLKHSPVFDDLVAVDPSDMITVRATPKPRGPSPGVPTRSIHETQYVLAGRVLTVDNWTEDLDIEAAVADADEATAEPLVASLRIDPQLFWKLTNGETVDRSARLTEMPAPYPPPSDRPAEPPACRVGYYETGELKLIVPEARASGPEVYHFCRPIGEIVACMYGQDMDPERLLPASYSPPPD